jgi:hypothetical protein
VPLKGTASGLPAYPNQFREVKAAIEQIGESWESNRMSELVDNIGKLTGGIEASRTMRKAPGCLVVRTCSRPSPEDDRRFAPEWKAMV